MDTLATIKSSKKVVPPCQTGEPRDSLMVQAESGAFAHPLFAIAVQRRILLMTTTRSATRTITAVAIAVMTIALGALATTRTCVNRAFRCIGLVQPIKRNLSRLRIHLNDFNLNNIAQVQNVFNLAYATVCHAGNVKEAVFA